MSGTTIKVTSSKGGAFDCYLSLPAGSAKTPAVVLACAIHGVDKDLRDIADEFASKGFIAAAPDLFWSSIPGPMSHDDNRAAERAQPRAEKIAAGEADLADTLTHLRTLPQFNGRAATMGFCYGGPYAMIGPKRLGFAAGISCHGSRMKDYIGEFDGVTQPVCILWGDQDHLAPKDVLDAYRALPPKQANVELHIFPGVEHGYMMPGHAKVYDAASREFSMARTIAILEGLRREGMRQAS